MPYYKLLLILVLSLHLISGCTAGIDKQVPKEEVINQFKIKGYKQFRLFQARYLLGYSENEEEIWNEPVYTGRPYHSSVTGEYSIEYTDKNLNEAKFALEGIVRAESALEKFLSIKLVLENPEEYVFERMYLLPKAKDNTELRKKRYIGALLKAKRIKLEFQTRSGEKIETESELKNYNINLEIKTNKEESLKGIFFAENVYVGYKLLDPPENPELRPDINTAKVLVLPFKQISGNPMDDVYTRMLRYETDNTMRLLSSKHGKVLIPAPIGNVFSDAENHISKKEDYPTSLIQEFSSRTDANLILSGKFIRYGNLAQVTVEFRDSNGDVFPAQYISHTLHNLEKPETSPSTFIKEWDIIVADAFNVYIQSSQLQSITNNSAAYNEYIKGVEEYSKFTKESLQKAGEHLDKAIELDPKLSEALAIRSEVLSEYIDQNFGKKETLEPAEKAVKEELLNKALDSGKKAVEMNSESYIANRALALYYYNKMEKEPDKYADAIKYIKAAIKLNDKDPDSLLLLYLINARKNGDKNLDEKNPDLQKALSLNSSSPKFKVFKEKLSPKNASKSTGDIPAKTAKIESKKTPLPDKQFVNNKIQQLLKTSEKENNPINSYFEIAKLYKTIDDRLTASIYYEKILNKDPGNIQANLELARHYASIGDSSKKSFHLVKIYNAYKPVLQGNNSAEKAKVYFTYAEIARINGNLIEAGKYEAQARQLQEKPKK